MYAQRVIFASLLALLSDGVPNIGVSLVSQLNY